MPGQKTKRGGDSEPPPAELAASRALLERIAPESSLAGLGARATLLELAGKQLAPGRHGHLAKWASLLQSLPAVSAVQIDLTQAAPRIGDASELSELDSRELREKLLQLGPWRKGPFSVFGIELDAEWRSDLKWSRLAPHLDCNGGEVLDVGCGNGYACLRLLGAGASRVVGIDPTLLYVMQFAALRGFCPELSACVLPLTLEQLPEGTNGFQLTLSMGVLYHRRSPIDHLLDLRRTLRPGGQLILETLIVEGPDGYSLVPEERYAAMKNVWFIPSLGTLQHWLRRVGFKSVEVLDVADTNSAEQRSTEWMPSLSLVDFLDPSDGSLTIEGHPAPRRAMLSARK